MLFSIDLRLTCAPTTGWRVYFPKKRLTHTQHRVNLVNTREQWLLDVHPTTVVLFQSLLFLLQPLKQAPAGLPAPASRDQLCFRAGLTAPSYSHHWPSHPSTHPHLLLFSRDDKRTSEPSYSSLRGLPLARLPRLRVVPFLGFAVVHRRGALCAAWSMWSRNDFHRKSTVRGEAESWVHGHSPVFLWFAK